MHNYVRTCLSALCCAGTLGLVACEGVTFSLTAPANGRSDAPVAASPYCWRNVRIGGGGFVSGIITHPRQKGLIYARTDIGGAYRWDSKAARWFPLTDWVNADQWTLTGIESLAVDPSDPKRVYIAAGTYTNDWSGNGAILRSSDQGRTWQRTDLPFKNGGNEDGRSMGERLAVDPNDGRVLFFGTRHEGLWKSVDRGATWKRVESFPKQADRPGQMGVVGVAWVVFDPDTDKPGAAPTRTLYAGTGDKSAPILRSHDGGETWEPVPGQPTGLLPHHAVLDIDGFLYLAYSDGPGPNGVTDGAVWKLNTDSDAWTNITPLKPGEGDKFGYAGVSLARSRPGVVMVSTLDRWAKKDTLFRSADGGRTWKDLGPQSTRDTSAAPYLTWGRPHAELGHWIGDLEIDPFDSSHVLYVTGMGIWASRNADAADKGRPTHWSAAASRGIEETVVNEVVSPPGSATAPVLSVMWDIDGFRHEKLDESPRAGFFKPSHGRNTGIDFAEHAPNVLARVYGAGDRSTGGAYSLDNGRTWTEFAARPENVGSGNGAIAVSADGAAFVWSPENGAASVTRDRGATWAACAGLPRGGVRVVADREDASRFYAFDRATGALYASRDGGATFAARATGLPKTDGFLRAAPGKTGHLWLATGQVLFRSTDGGVTIRSVGSGVNARRIGFGKAAPGRAYPALYAVGTVGGVYGFFRSDDEGATWTRINDDHNQFGSINSITGDPRVYGRVYVGSANRGVLVGDPVAGAKRP
jgi:photosystem II stability/assembly factor-like uncharacterized protein